MTTDISSIGTLSYQKSQGLAPQWMDDEGFELVKKYLAHGELSPSDIYHRLANTASAYLGADFYTPLYECFWKGYLSPATPVATNFGATRLDEDGKVKFRALPVSCFGLKPKNSIDGIFKTAHEAAMLSKNGGGLGINVSDLRGDTPVTHWAKLYDVTAKIVSQGGVRRGAAALYLDIEHPDIETFLHAKEMLEGDPREKIDSNIAVIIPDSFIQKLKDGDDKARKIYAKVLELRMKHGNPYLFFIDNANRQKGVDYETLGLDINTSQLCNEIALYCDHEHTFVCVLSSVVASRYHSFKDKTWDVYGKEWSVPALGIAFLDAVTSEFIRLADDIPGLENAVRFARKSRALGLGLLGWHTLLQQQFLAFDDDGAYELNKEIWKYMADEANDASVWLGQRFGIPEWCKASQRRHTHLLAVAPTLANSVLSAAGSPSVEPLASNQYAYVGANGNYLRNNKVLQKYLQCMLLDTPEVWAQITEHDGSIQFLRDTLIEAAVKQEYVYPKKSIDEALNVFKTAYEIDQKAIVKQAADRQPYICQGQSINLFLKHDTDAQDVSNLHLMAWKLGLKGLYYVRSTRAKVKATTLEADKLTHQWYVETKEGCPYCSKAKMLLKQKEQVFQEQEVLSPVEGVTYPRIWLDNDLLGGYDELVAYYNEEVSCPLDNSGGSEECLACHG